MIVPVHAFRAGEDLVVIPLGKRICKAADSGAQAVFDLAHKNRVYGHRLRDGSSSRGLVVFVFYRKGIAFAHLPFHPARGVNIRRKILGVRHAGEHYGTGAVAYRDLGPFGNAAQHVCRCDFAVVCHRYGFRQHHNRGRSVFNPPLHHQDGAGRRRLLLAGG